MNSPYKEIVDTTQDKECAYLILGDGFLGGTLWFNLKGCNKELISRNNINYYLPIKTPTYLAMEFTDKLRYAVEGQFNSFRKQGYKKIVIINAIASTNTSPKASFGDAFTANMVVPGVIARVVRQQRFHRTEFRIIQISTACLYDDSRMEVDGFWNVHKEDSSITEPSNHQPYYFTKLGGECMYGEVRHQTCILRPRLVYGVSESSSNLLNKVSKYACVVDCPQSMTHIDTLCAAAVYAGRNNLTGIYNVVDDGQIKLSDYFPDIPLKPCDANFKVIWVDNSKLKATGFPTVDGNTIFKNCVDGLSTV